MEEQQQTPKPGFNCSWCSCVDTQWLLGRIQEIVTNPQESWAKIKSENMSVKDIYQKFLIPLLGVATICRFLGHVIFVGTPFFQTLVCDVILFGAYLVSPFITASIVEKVAPKFQATTSHSAVFQLLVFSAAPCLAAGVLGIYPNDLFHGLEFLISLYSLYIIYIGFPVLVEVPKERLVAFLASVVVCSMLVVGILFGTVYAVFRPVSPEMQDLEQLQKNIKNLQRIIPGVGQ